MEKITNIAKNTSYLTVALVLQKIISFSYFALLARNLDPENLGKYYFAISFTTIFAIFIDFGMSNVLTREVAKKPEESKNILGTMIATKIILTAITFFAIVLVINLMGYPELTKNLVYVSSFCVILDAFTLSFFSTIRGFYNLFFESISSVLFQAIVIIFGLYTLYTGKSLTWIISALLVASIFNFLYSYFVLVKKFKIKVIPIFNFRGMMTILKISIPFGVFAIFQRVYTYLDSVILSVMSGDKEVGLYQVSFKIIFALQFLPMAFTASLYPAMSNYWLNNKKQLAVSFERAINYLIIISLPISGGIIILADKIIFLFKESYIDAIFPLRIIILSLLFIFINFPIGSLLNACDKQKINTINMGITAFFSVILNLILVPKFQAVGASITVLISSFLMFFLGIIQVPKIIDYNILKNVIIFLKSLFATLIMVLVIIYLKSFFNFLILIFIGCFIYFFVLYFIRGFKKEDVASIFNSFVKK